MTSISNAMAALKGRPTLLALLGTVLTVVLPLCVFDPSWETNDDVAMSMIAHGYGLAAQGSPNLIFSNVLWGYFVRAIPSINGVLGYSLATIVVLLVIGWALLYYLLRLGAGFLVGLIVVALLIARPAVFPQFTINAGLLTLTAILGWRVYAKHGGTANLAVACMLAFAGFLIREAEFLLVLGVALPLLSWRALRDQRKMRFAFLLLGLMIALAGAFDRWSYSGSDWRQFVELNSARVPFTDYDAGEYLRRYPEIMERHGYSENDTYLLGEWFFVDTQMANAEILNAMLADLGPIPMQGGRVGSGLEAIKALSDPILLPLMLPALLLLFLVPGRVLLLTWLLCIGSLFAIGVMGRPGILRVYVPLLSLLLVAPFLVDGSINSAKKRMLIAILCLACMGNAYVFIPQALETSRLVKQIKNEVHVIPIGPIVNWGYSFPFELAFPLLANDIQSRSILFYGLDSFTHAPFSVAAVEQKAGRGMVSRMQTFEGISIIAFPPYFEYLRIYCKEHWGGRLRDMITEQNSWLTIRQVRCESEY